MKKLLLMFLCGFMTYASAEYLYEWITYNNYIPESQTKYFFNNNSYSQHLQYNGDKGKLLIRTAGETTFINQMINQNIKTIFTSTTNNKFLDDRKIYYILNSKNEPIECSLVGKYNRVSTNFVVFLNEKNEEQIYTRRNLYDINDWSYDVLIYSLVGDFLLPEAQQCKDIIIDNLK